MVPYVSSIPHSSLTHQPLGRRQEMRLKTEAKENVQEFALGARDRWRAVCFSVQIHTVQHSRFMSHENVSPRARNKHTIWNLTWPYLASILWRRREAALIEVLHAVRISTLSEAFLGNAGSLSSQWVPAAGARRSSGVSALPVGRLQWRYTFSYMARWQGLGRGGDCCRASQLHHNRLPFSLVFSQLSLSHHLISGKHFRESLSNNKSLFLCSVGSRIDFQNLWIWWLR